MAEELKKFRCTVCGYEVEATELEDDYVCPVCGVSKDDFEDITE